MQNDVAPTVAPSPSAEEDPAKLAEELAKRRAKNLTLPKEPVDPEEVEDTEKPGDPPKKSKKKLFIALSVIFVLLLAAGGGTAYYFLVYKPEQDNRVDVSQITEKAPSADPEKKKEEPPKIYSRLSGEPISSEAEDSAPTYCVQVPNGVDGARPQVGLTDAKVVFEAIAESGITRFAAIFQNPPAVIGPIRSLRIYYLNWDTPFDCTVVHAGGADDAIAALKTYGSRDLSEDMSYMWRTQSTSALNRLWNNLFTSGELLKNFNDSKGYLSSDIKAFPRFSPSDAEKNKINLQAVHKLKIDTPSTGNTDELSPKVAHFSFTFGSIPNFNPVFDYDAETNSYRRSYETGAPHEVYDCAGQSGEIVPEAVCTPKQLSPSVVIAMVVQEKKAAYDNYHEDIASIGAGDAYIFQNGDVIKGTWEKSSPTEQILFRNEAGETISLVPGQTWISAVPAYGSVNF